MRLAPDWLFDRMAAPGQGWHIQNEHGDQWPSPALLDLAVIKAASTLAQQGGRLAVGVPSVVTGIALGPAIYTAINALIQGDSVRQSRVSGFTPFPLPPNGPIVVASRSHAVRDLLAESLVTFRQSQWRLCQFPTFRLTRTGDLEPGIYGRLSRLQRPRPQEILRTATPLVLYDYWPFAQTAKLSKAGAVFAELAENDGYSTIERLLDLLDRTQPGFAMAILNYNDVEKRRRLAHLGFQFLAAQSLEPQTQLSPAPGTERRPFVISTPTTLSGRAAPETTHLLPSFGSVDKRSPKRADVTFMALPPDSTVSEALAEAFKLLSEMHSRVSHTDTYPLPLTRAWYVLDHLASCPISLERYEQLRKRDPREYSLGFRLEKMEYVDWGNVPRELQGTLRLNWPHILEKLKVAYAALWETNPKWWAIAETILDAQESLGVLLPNRLAAQGLRDEMLIEFGWKDYDSHVQVRSFSEARRNEERFDHITLLGNWKDWQRPLFFGCLPQQIDVVGYEYEACVLDKRLRSIQADIDTNMVATNRALLSSLFGAQAVEHTESTEHSLGWNAAAIQTARTGAGEISAIILPAGTYQIDCALIIGRRKDSHDEKLSLNEVLREFELAV